MTWKMTISMAPRRDPAVLPIGRKGTAGKTANTQNIAKDNEPKTTLTAGDIAIVQASKADNLIPSRNSDTQDY